HTSFSRDWSSDVCSSDLVIEDRLPAKFIATQLCPGQIPPQQLLRLGRLAAHLVGITKHNIVKFSATHTPTPTPPLKGRGSIFLKIGRASCRGRAWLPAGA